MKEYKYPFTNIKEFVLKFLKKFLKNLKIFFHQKDIEEYRQVKILIFLLFKEVNFLYNIQSERVQYE